MPTRSPTQHRAEKMNNAMAKLAEALNIDHAKMPREQMAEAVCEKALKHIEQLEALRAELLHNFEENPEVFADTVWCKNRITTLYELANFATPLMLNKATPQEQIGMAI